MNHSRRTFIGTSIGAAVLTTLPGNLLAQATSTLPVRMIDPDSEIVNLRERIPRPVIIDAIQIVRADKVMFIRTRSKDGVTGTSVGNIRMPNLVQLLENLVIPHFVGRDARDLEQLVHETYIEHYKYSGVPFWNSVGQVEWSLFDLLGQIANKPAAAFFGPMIRTKVPVYISTWSREKTAEETVEEITGPVERTGVQAVKLKIGGRMSNNTEPVPGRTARLIPLARKTFGDAMTLYADSNGSYDIEHAIAVGRTLEEYDYAVVEEPVPWEDFVATKAVADALTKITVAGGEQDTSLPKWRWMIENRAVDLVQPDLIYNGGFIRATRVARMAEQAGLSIAPHAPAMGPEAAMKYQFASVTPNLSGYQEHREERDERTWYEPKFVIKNGIVEVPSGPGLGVQYDPGLWRKAEMISCMRG